MVILEQYFIRIEQSGGCIIYHKITPNRVRLGLSKV